MGINDSFVRKSTPNRLPLFPSFFIIGPPRTGTTWLHQVLSKYAVLPSPTKETRFFDAHFDRGIEWYLAHFTPSVNKQMGEVAPTYFASRHARERIARLIPQARVICIFRDPLERVLSLYRLKQAYGMLRCSFDEALQKDPELVESGKYATHLREWLNVLGPNQVMPTFYEDLKGDLQAYVDKLADFISLPRFALSQEEICNIHGSENMTHPRNYFFTRAAVQTADWLKAYRLDTVVASFKRSPLIKNVLGGGTNFEGVSPEAAARVYELFRPEIEELETILGRDLSLWKPRSSELERPLTLTVEGGPASAGVKQHLGPPALCLQVVKRSDHDIPSVPIISPQSSSVGPFDSPFADFTARCFLRLSICIEVFDGWKRTRMARPDRGELWWIQRPGLRLPFRVSPWAGEAFCLVAAVLTTILFYENPVRTVLPLAFLTVIAGAAILFGRLAGIMGTVTAALVFASVLFEPRPGLAIADPVAKAHLAWMTGIGLVLSDLIGRRNVGPISETRKSHDRAF